MIQINTCFTGMINTPELEYLDQFLEKSRYAATIGKPMYLFINGKEKYPIRKLRLILNLPWRRIFIRPEASKDIGQYYENVIIKDAAFFNLVMRI